MPAAIAVITLFFSQMAMLAAAISFAKTVTIEDVHAKYDQQRRGSEGQIS
jgi:hypothetical protein